MRHGPNLPGEADFPPTGKSAEWFVEERGDEGKSQRQVDGRFDHSQPSDQPGIDLPIVEGDASVPGQYCEELVESCRFDPPCASSRLHQLGWSHQRLHFHQDGPSALDGRYHDRSGHVVPPVAEEHLGGIRHFNQAGGSHLEKTDDVSSSETILEAPKCPEALIGLPLQIEHDIDHVFEMLGPGDAAVLRDVSNEDHRNVLILGKTCQSGATLSHLRNRTRAASDLGGADGLNRIHDEQIRTLFGGCGDDCIHILLGKQRNSLCHHPKPLRPQSNLIFGLLGRGDEHLAAARSEAPSRLQ